MGKEELIKGRNITLLKEQQKLPLWKKVEHSKRVIKQFFSAMDGKVYVSFSGGKDSTVLLHLVRSVFPDTVAVFSNTTNEYPEILKYVKNTENVIWIHPKMTFKEVVKTIGFPVISKENAKKINELNTTKSAKLKSKRLFGDEKGNGKLPEIWQNLIKENENLNITAKCCDILKIKPFIKFEKETNLKGFVGTLAEESVLRKEDYIQNGCNIFTEGNEKSRPLSIWTEQDIWDYAKTNNIRFCELYYDSYSKDGKLILAEDRTGCMVCGFGYHLEKSDLFTQDRFDKLKLRRPKLYEKYMNLENNGITFREALSVVKNAKKVKKEK